MEPASPYRPVLERTLTHATAYLETLAEAPVVATATLAELRRRLARPLIDNGVDAVQVIDELVSDVAGGVLGSAGDLQDWRSVLRRHRMAWQTLHAYFRVQLADERDRCRARDQGGTTGAREIMSLTP
jgi:hypothetical protein